MGGGGGSPERTPREPRDTPCSCIAASRARRSSSPRTPCSCIAASRARRSLSPGTPCRGILGCPSRAGTTDLAVSWPPPSAISCQDSSAWRRVLARSGVTFVGASNLTRLGAFSRKRSSGRRTDVMTREALASPDESRSRGEILHRLRRGSTLVSRRLPPVSRNASRPCALKPNRPPRAIRRPAPLSASSPLSRGRHVERRVVLARLVARHRFISRRARPAGRRGHGTAHGARVSRGWRRAARSSGDARRRRAPGGARLARRRRLAGSPPAGRWRHPPCVRRLGAPRARRSAPPRGGGPRARWSRARPPGATRARARARARASRIARRPRTPPRAAVPGRRRRGPRPPRRGRRNPRARDRRAPRPRPPPPRPPHPATRARRAAAPRPRGGCGAPR